MCGHVPFFAPQGHLTAFQGNAGTQGIMRGRTSGGWALEVFENEEAGLKKKSREILQALHSAGFEIFRIGLRGLFCILYFEQISVGEIGPI
jgi:hypothetical protein